MYIQNVKSNGRHTNESERNIADPLSARLRQEKEALVSMFLANATISQLAAQYKVIDELTGRMKSDGPRS